MLKIGQVAIDDLGRNGIRRGAVGGFGLGDTKSLKKNLRTAIQAVRKFRRCREGSWWRSSQCQPLQAFKPREIAIEAHQAPAIGDRQGCQICIGAQTGRQLTAVQQLVKHLPAGMLS